MTPWFPPHQAEKAQDDDASVAQTEKAPSDHSDQDYEEQNVESDLLKQQAGYLEPAKKRLGLAQFMALRAYESKVWPQFDLRCAVSENDDES